MQVFINNVEVQLAEGMTVQHAITALTGALPEADDVIVRDQWGNQVGMDGVLRNGEHLITEMKQNNGKVRP